MDFAITKISSKGQIVIPAELRTGLAEGDKMLIIRNDNHILLKKTSDMKHNFEEDIEFAKRTENAWKKYENKEFHTMDFDDFMKQAKKW